MKEFLIGFSLIVLSSSCITSSPQYKKDYSIGIHIYNNCPFNSGVSSNHGVMISAGFEPYQPNSPKVIKINSLELNKGNEFAIQDLSVTSSNASDFFGNYLVVKLDSQLLNGTFYSPKRFIVSYDVKKHGGNIETGMLFNWEADSKDSKASKVQVTLRSIDYENYESIIKSTVINDDGRFKLPSHWLNSLSPGSFVTLNMQRGNKHIVDNKSDQKILIASQSSVIGTFMVAYPKSTK